MVIPDDDCELPFEPRSLDLAICSNYMHWINDLPGFFKRVQDVLKEDGVFVGALFGGETLQELRTAFMLAEQEREGGVSPHVSPFAHIRDMGNVMTRAGFALPTGMFSLAVCETGTIALQLTFS